MQSEALNVINDLKHDMTASPVDDVTIITRAQLEAIEAALSAAEPVATVAEMGAGGMRVLMPHPPGSADRLPIGTKLYPAPPAPSVAVKALQPFATEADIYDGQDIDDGEKSFNDNITVGDLRRARAALSAQVQDVSGWQTMDTAPKDGKHCLLAVKSGPFVYAVQGAYSMGEWGNAADIHSEPLCWMPLTRIPPGYLPWTDEFAAAAPAKQEG